MSVLIDEDIERYCRYHELIEFEDQYGSIHRLNEPMISPFSPPVSGCGLISYGVTSAGYDMTLADEFVMFKNVYNEAIDPKQFNDPHYVNKVTEKVYAEKRLVLPPYSYVLGRSVEYFNIPKWVKGTCEGKSTYARCQVIVNVTPLEPGWKGHLCIEIGNVGIAPAVIYVGEGIAQIEFKMLPKIPRQTYDSKHGKYQGQTGVTLAKVL